MLQMSTPRPMMPKMDMCSEKAISPKLSAWAMQVYRKLPAINAIVTPLRRARKLKNHDDHFDSRFGTMSPMSKTCQYSSNTALCTGIIIFSMLSSLII
ncbi:Hypothetical protein NTJ_15884 [Nesidiocoris tenuis]|uniref:Uncharacterized protein n=1 Tax=Nesidiocoris tenuis TaxID=355587 RepID=A0ABN7BHZ6_9HEMI|nr:Hypothetical protein NTJ_15884 [Nesidiocoris tenuis]